ncbi:HalD/BesD family halogenase [Paraburkholderia fungorum]
MQTTFDTINFDDVISSDVRAEVHRPEHEVSDYVRALRSDLASTGCAVVRNFISPSHLATLEQESRALSAHAFFSRRKVNPYATADDASIEANDPRRHFVEYSNGFVARDLIPERSVLQTIFRSAQFKRFIAAVLELPTVHEYADPIAGLVINVMPDGSELPWHFDTNDFVVSLLTVKPESGGQFEYCTNLRSGKHENFSGVKAVIKGDRGPVTTLDLTPGDLQIFKGRNSLHRVTPTVGERHTVLFGYSTEPGVVGRPERTRLVYGRVLQAHLDAESEARADGLLD